MERPHPVNLFFFTPSQIGPTPMDEKYGINEKLGDSSLDYVLKSLFFSYRCCSWKKMKRRRRRRRKKRKIRMLITLIEINEIDNDDVFIVKYRISTANDWIWMNPAVSVVPH